MNLELIRAAKIGDRDRVERLLRQGADIRDEGDFALRRAAYYGHEAIVRLLLDPHKYGLECDGADIHAGNDWALRWAAYFGHEAVVRLLLDPRKNDIDSDGADIHAEDYRGPDAALRSAAFNGHEAVVRLLLDPHKYGLEVSGCDRNILAQRYPQMLTKIQHIEQQELYQAAQVMYYALYFARRNAYTKGQVGALHQALDMNLS